MKNGLDEQYIDLLTDILENGVEKNTRNGKVLSVFGRTIRYKFKDGKFPLLTTKKMYFKGIVTELLWFLRGSTNIKFLVDNDCHIWDGDAYKNYERKMNFAKRMQSSVSSVGEEEWRILSMEEFINKIKTDDEFAKKFGELGPIYGRMWRAFDEDANGGIDQITNLIRDLKTNPDSRRLLVTAWNPTYLPHQVLPPCHYGFQVYTRELSNKERYRIWFNRNYETGMEFNNELIPDFDDKYYEPTPKRAISLMWNQRSVDTFLGLPFNIASYGLLLEIIAKIVNMVPDELIGNLGDTHLYLNHIEQAKEQIGRKYTPEERHSMLKEMMGEEFYKTTLSELMPFGGGLSEYYDSYKIPHHSRESFNLPTLKLPKTDVFWNGFDVSLFGHLNPTDFVIENYQSHPSIKAPLSN